MIKQIFAVLVTFCSCNCLICQYEIIPTFTNSNIREIDFYNNELFIIGNGYYVAKCDQNGGNLTLKSPPGPTINGLTCFDRIDTNTAYIVSVGNPFDNATFEVYKTIDNAETWQLLYDTLSQVGSTLIMFDSLEGIRNNKYDSLFRTVDGGNTWIKENSPYPTIEIFDKFQDSIVCTGYVENFSISYDRGGTWTSNYFPQTQPLSFDIISKDTIIATSNTGYLLKTYNKGFSWEEVYVGGYFCNKIKQQNKDTIFIVGSRYVLDEFGNPIDHGIIVKSTDFGQTWSMFDTELLTSFFDIEFVNDSIAFISGNNGVLIRYNYRDHHLGLENLNLNESNIQFYPNPTNGIFELKNVSNVENISVVDFSGKTIKEFKNLPVNQFDKIQIDISVLPAGFYNLILKSNNNLNHFKIIKN